tara:strand:- start:39 stop:314 length:276 start_codon:yes stop_codon:yes gene_type:complete
MITALALFVFALAGWTIATLVAKGEHTEAIKDELGNMFETLKLFGSSIKSLIQILIKSTFSDNSIPRIEEKKDNVVSIADNEEKPEESKAA